MTVATILSGGVTSTQAVVVAKVAPSASCRLAYQVGASLSAPSYTSAGSADSDGYVTFTVTGLAPSTAYTYGVEEAGVLDAIRGKLTTSPVEGVAASFTIAHASCTSYYDVAPSDHRVYDAIAAKGALRFLMLGDLHYGDITTNDESLYRAKIADSIGTARAKAMWASTPMTYVWDDHDFGPDNADGSDAGGPAVAVVYRQMIPHYTLPDASAVYQAWTIGRVRFIQTDLRFYRSPDTDTDDSSKSMLGATQKAWLKAELLAAKDGPLTVWLNSQVWGVPATGWAGIDTDGDHWGAFSTERAELSDYLADNGVTNVIQLTGDQHALGIRREADFSAAGGAPMRVYSAAALDALPVTRDGGWDEVQAGRGQYGTLTVTDDGSQVDVLWQGWQVDPTTGVESLVMSDTFTLGSSVAGGKPVMVHDGSSWVARPVKVWDGAAWVRRPATLPA